MLHAFPSSCRSFFGSSGTILERCRAGFRFPVRWLQGLLEHAYGPLPLKKRRAQSQAAAVQMLRQELAQVICFPGIYLLFIHCGGMLRVILWGSCTARRAQGVQSLSVGRHRQGRNCQITICWQIWLISIPAPCRSFSMARQALG